MTAIISEPTDAPCLTGAYDVSTDEHCVICFDGEITYSDRGVGVATRAVGHLPRIAEPGEPTSLQQSFDRLVSEWRSGCGHTSKLAEMVLHPAYQRIVGMGKPAIPLLLAEMQKQCDHWDWALRAITGVDPVPHAAWGKLHDIARAWCGWGKEQGYIR